MSKVDDDFTDALGSLKKAVPVFADMPMINYDEDSLGWESVFNGILSPFATKYKSYIDHEL